MKKLLLSLLFMLSLTAMAVAETYTYTITFSELEGFGAVTNSNLETFSVGGFTFVPEKGTNTSNAPAYNKSGDIRVYANNTFTVKANGANITSISFAISSQGMDRFPEVTPSEGAIEAQGVNPLVWNGTAASITFTPGDKAVYSKVDPTKPGQFDFTAVTIVTDGEIADVPGTPDQPEEVTNLTAFSDFEKGAAFTMGIDLTVAYSNGSNVYVTDGTSYAMIYKKDIGLASGDVVAKGWTGKVDIYNGLTELVPDDALTVIGTASVPAPYEVDAEMASVMLMPYNQNLYVKLIAVTFSNDTPSTRANFTGVMGEGDDAYTVTFRNNYLIDAVTAGTYDVIAFIGVYNETVQVYPIEYIGSSGIVETPEIDSFNVLYDFEDGTEFKVGVDVKVLFADGAYVYVNDGYQNALIYKKNLGLNAGDVIGKGWKAALSIYNGLYEIVPIDDLSVIETGAAIPAPMEVTADDVNMFVAAYNQAAYIKLIGVKFDEATPTKGEFTGTMGESTVTFYQRFGLESVDAGLYDVEGFVAVYGEKVQIYPTKIGKSTGITAITADTQSARFYNLQGVEVANPQSGNIYIRVQGDKATKIIK